MKKKVLFAGIGAVAAISGAAIVSAAYAAKRYAKAYNNGLRIASKKNGIPYYSNVLLVITNDKITPVQLRELTVLTGGSVEKSEQTDFGVYTTFLLPEYHSLKGLDQMGEDIGAACEYVEFAGFMGAEEE